MPGQQTNHALLVAHKQVPDAYRLAGNGPLMRVIRIKTTTATLEWAIHSPRVEWVVDRLKMADVL
jgi:hypothetical protein